MKTIALIPVYKAMSLLNNYEEMSIVNNFRQLNSSLDFAFIGPKELMNEYIIEYPQSNFYCFKKKYFANVQGYNDLLKSLAFYRTFENYNFMLIIQTDAWILGSPAGLLGFYKFDYSGAISYHNDKPIGYNGGLSLRNVQASIKALKSWRNYETPLKIWRRHFPVGCFPKPYKLVSVILDLLIRKKVHHRFNVFNRGNEDIFWSVLVPKAVPEFKVITNEDAVKFSWENNCEELNKTNELPFGCHGWWNYNYDFWKEIIDFEFKNSN